MKRDTLLLIALLLAAVLANRALAEHDPQPDIVPEAPAADDGADEQPQPKPRSVPIVPYGGASAPIHPEPEAPPRPPAAERQEKPATVERSEDGIKIFQLKNVRPEEVVPTLHVLFPHRVTVSAVPSQRMLIARGPENELRKVEAILLRLDESRSVPTPGFEGTLRLPQWSPPNAKGSDDVVEEEVLESDNRKLPGNYSQKCYQLRHVRVMGVVGILEWMRQREGAEWFEMDMNHLKNTLTVRASADVLQQIEALLRYVDTRNTQFAPQAGEESSSGGRTREDAVHESSAGVLRPEGEAAFSSGDPRWEKHVREGRHLSLKGVRTVFAELDAKARQVAQRLRASIESRDDAVESGDLRGAVTKAFDARQTLQRRELAELAERLAAIGQSLEARQRMKDEIINRRVEELLRPELEWDASNDSPPVHSPSSRADLSRASETDSWREETQLDPTDAATPGQPSEGLHAIRVLEPDPSGVHILGPLLGEIHSVVQGKRTIIIEPVSLATIKEGDDLQVSRPREGDKPRRERIAEVKVTSVGHSFVEASLVSARREHIGGRFMWMTPLPGDFVHSPSSEESTLMLSRPEGQEAMRFKTAKNLKHIMLAFHNYHDEFNHFPPAIVKGQQERGLSEHVHSWRVAILPFLGQPELSKLYGLYRFDEPWDSEHNKSLLSEMPDVYRSPVDVPNSIHTSYFAVVTPHLPPIDEGGWKRGTLFSNPQGTPIREIHDGTSNTIAVVEAKRAVPWTKPEDVPFDVDGPLPALGGWFAEGFHAGFADGSAHFVSKENDAQTLRHLLLIQDGAVVEPEFVK